MTVILEPPKRWWKCPSCGLTDWSQTQMPHTQMHPCAALGGINVPLVEVHDADAKVAAAHVAVGREDGPGTAAIRTERLDGSNDVTILAPVARSGVAGRL